VRRERQPRKEGGLTAKEPGFDGTKIMTSTVRLSSARTEKRSVRARPGTFEWRYGRKSADAALYHAGCHFADLWERAGTAAAKSRDLTQVGTPGWRGLPEGRAAALDAVGTATRELGRFATWRLMAYCVEGQTTAEIARRQDAPERDMAAVLHQDLKACAEWCKFVGKR
jgi:hypothetical protein